MKYIAYKIASGNPNLPAGFITEHFATNSPTLDGYYVVTQEAFNALFQNNLTLYRNMELANGARPADPNAPPPVVRLASEAQNVPQAVADAATQAASQTNNNAALFAEFIAWQASKGS